MFSCNSKREGVKIRLCSYSNVNPSVSGYTPASGPNSDTRLGIASLSGQPERDPDASGVNGDPTETQEARSHRRSTLIPHHP